MTPIVPRETVDDAQLTAERVKQYLDAADNELGHWCCEPWVETCRAVLRAALTAPQHSVTEEDERAAFEAHYRDQIARGKLHGLDDGSFARSPAGTYLHMYIGAYWHGWKAGRFQPLPFTAATQHDAGQAALDAVHKLICSHIKEGPLPGNGCDETAQRNGLILAANIVARAGGEADAVSRGTIPDSIAQISLDLEPNRSGGGGEHGMFSGGGGGAGDSFLFPTGGGGRDGS